LVRGGCSIGVSEEEGREGKAAPLQGGVELEGPFIFRERGKKLFFCAGGGRVEYYLSALLPEEKKEETVFAPRYRRMPVTIRTSFSMERGGKKRNDGSSTSLIGVGKDEGRKIELSNGGRGKKKEKKNLSAFRFRGEGRGWRNNPYAWHLSNL